MLDFSKNSIIHILVQDTKLRYNNFYSSVGLKAVTSVAIISLELDRRFGSVSALGEREVEVILEASKYVKMYLKTEEG